MTTPDRPSAGQESVWDYPRPAVAEPYPGHVRIVHRGRVLADTRRAVRTLETSHPPSYYIPRADIDMVRLRPSSRSSVCEWKGAASYVDVVDGGDVARDAGWSYLSPTEAFAILAGHIAFYARPFEGGPQDGCFVDGEKAAPQPGPFYGGWITSRVAGPFKGAPGSMLW